jgi:hypothetical protein
MTYQQATTSSKIDERSLQILRRMYSTLETRAPDKEDYLICKFSEVALQSWAIAASAATCMRATRRISGTAASSAVTDKPARAAGERP